MRTPSETLDTQRVVKWIVGIVAVVAVAVLAVGVLAWASGGDDSEPSRPTPQSEYERFNEKPPYQQWKDEQGIP